MTYHDAFKPDFLKGQTALITGGGTGIGRALALACARFGANIAVCARRLEPLEETCRMVGEFGGRSLALTCDIRDEDRVEEVVGEFWDHFGRIDVLLNNAGGNFLCPAVAMSPKGWRSVIDINLNGTFYVTRAVGSRMLGDGRGGRVVTITATNGEMGSPLIAHSGASKAGLNNLTQSLAVEWAGAGVRVNAVAPGAVRTEGSDERLWTDEDRVKKMEARIPLGRMAYPEDVVGPVLFLLSPAADFITGAIVHVDGGARLTNPADLG